MKILFIVPIYIKDFQNLKTLYLLGGGSRYPYELARNLALNKNDSVEIMLFSSVDAEEKIDGMSIVLVKSLSFLPSINGTSNPIPMSPLFFQKIRNADIVHGYQIRSDATLFASIFSKIVRKPIMITDTNFNGVSFARFLRPEYIADAVLAISKEDYDSWHARKKYIIYGGVPKESFPYKKEKSKYVLYFGRILSHKGVDVLVEATPADIQLVIAGSSPDKTYIKYLRKISKKKKVIFKENVSDKEMVKLYQNASCFVLPATKKDYLGKEWGRPGLYALVVPEAMSCGTPIIVSNVGALPDFIEKGRYINGFVFEDRNIQDLQSKIMNIFSNKKLQYTLGKNGRYLVETKYDWKVIAKNTRGIYKSFIQ